MSDETDAGNLAPRFRRNVRRKVRRQARDYEALGVNREVSDADIPQFLLDEPDEVPLTVRGGRFFPRGVPVRLGADRGIAEKAVQESAPEFRRIGFMESLSFPITLMVR